MPPLAPYSQLTTNDGQPFVGNYDNGCLYLEGLVERSELHYKASDMEALAAADPFDLALTQERFGIREWVCDPCLVASPRFYKFCVANNLRMNWMPVRLETQ